MATWSRYLLRLNILNNPLETASMRIKSSKSARKPPENRRFSVRVAYYGYRYYDPVTGRWPSRDPIHELAFITTVYLRAASHAELKSAIRESYELRLYIKSMQSVRKSLIANDSKNIGLLYEEQNIQGNYYLFTNNSSINYIDVNGTVAQWLAACGGGCVLGGIGGAIGGFVTGGGLSGTLCGGLGGAVAGCCSAVICTAAPTLCIRASCICGMVGGITTNVCGNGFKLDYKDPCFWFDAVSGGAMGCLGAMGGGAKEELLKFLTGMDITALSTACGKINSVL